MNDLHSISTTRFILLALLLVGCLTVSFKGLAFLPTLPLVCLFVESLIFGLLFRFVFQPTFFNDPFFVSFQLLHDIIALSLFFSFTGGPTNPLTGLYLIPILYGALLLPFINALGVFLITSGAYIFISMVYMPLQLVSVSHDALMRLHYFGMIASYFISATLMLFFIARLVRHIQDREAKLRRVSSLLDTETHLVNIGILATTAAHDLNTPLSTLSMIHEELSHQTLSHDAQALLEKGHVQILRCQEALSKILKTSGHAAVLDPSAEHLRLTTFLDTMLSSLTLQFPQTQFTRSGTCPDLLLSETRTLEACLFNLLSNSAKVAASVSILADLSDQTLVFCIKDTGPGLSDLQLKHIQEPLSNQLLGYAETSDTTHGMGLILVQFLAQRLGGALSFDRTETQTLTTLEIPLSVVCHD